MNLVTCTRHSLCVATIALSCMASATAQTAFPTSYQYAAGNNPYAGELCDVNGDSHLDYLVSNSFTTLLSVYLGTGTGTGEFVPMPSITTTSVPRGIAVGDLDSDGILDVALILPSPGKVELLRGDGAGGFLSIGLLDVGGFPVWIEAGHFNADGLLDLAVGTQAGSNVTVFLATGPGTFGPGPAFLTGGYRCEEIAVADINGDGPLDIAVASWLDNRVLTFIGDGSGGFTRVASQFTSSPKSLGLGDFDQNGTTDLVVTNQSIDGITVFPAKVTGGLDPGLYTSFGVQETPSHLVVTDISGDGVPDVVASANTNDELKIFVGTGTGQVASSISSPVGISTRHLASGDLNGDGIPDIAGVSGGLDTISVHLSDGVGSFTEYCTGKVNSFGCLPEVQASGTPSVSDLTPFFVRVDNLVENQAALFVYKAGGMQADVPFNGGTLCVGPTGIRRTPVLNTGKDGDLTGSCTGRILMDFNNFALGQSGGNPDPALLLIGNTYHLQLWCRDPGDAFGVSLSNGLAVTPWL